MQCISPILLKKGQFVPCGKCNFCLQARRLDWSFRLKQELRVSKSARFVTLTYDDEHVPINPETGLAELSKKDVQLFIKRLRKYNSKIVARLKWPTMRYYLVGEYGTRTGRPHYHLIVFNISVEATNWLAHIWGQGQIRVGQVTPASIMYTCKYHLGSFDNSDLRPKSFHLSQIGAVVWDQTTLSALSGGIPKIRRYSVSMTEKKSRCPGFTGTECSKRENSNTSNKNKSKRHTKQR